MNDRAEVACPSGAAPQVLADQPSARSALLRVLRVRPCTLGQLRHLLGDAAVAAFAEAEARGEVAVRVDTSGGGLWRVPVLVLTGAGYRASDVARREASGEPVWLVRAERADVKGQGRLL
jgi:hypothetical protein